MNLDKLFQMQKALDERINKEHQLEGQDLLPKKILALQVELGELANEWRGFKFWKVNQQPVTYKRESIKQLKKGLELFDNHEGAYETVIKESNPLLEEYVDCLHFILSIGLELNFDKVDYEYLHEHNIPVYKSSRGITEQFNSVYLSVTTLNYDNDLEFYEEMCLYFIGLGEMLGFTWEQIEQAYLEKNKVNHSRQTEGY